MGPDRGLCVGLFGQAVLCDAAAGREAGLGMPYRHRQGLPCILEWWMLHATGRLEV